MKPAEQTPASMCVLIELIQDILPKGVLNIVQGTGIRSWETTCNKPTYR